jgi:hypothetical protein
MLKVTGMRFQPYVQKLQSLARFKHFEFELEECPERKARMADLRCSSAERGTYLAQPGRAGEAAKESSSPVGRHINVYTLETVVFDIMPSEQLALQQTHKSVTSSSDASFH